MNATMEHGPGDFRARMEEVRTSKAAGGGSVVEALDCVGVIVLAILGLSGVLTADLLAIAVIAFGVSLLFESGAIGARYSRSRRLSRETDYGNVKGGVATEFLAGLAGAVLGIITLAGIGQTVLPAVAVIVFGAALLLGSMATRRLRHIEAESPNETACAAVSAAAGLEWITGAGAIVLGILALVGYAAAILSLVALLALSGAILLESMANSRRLLQGTKLMS